jgi:hypothetical protein
MHTALPLTQTASQETICAALSAIDDLRATSDTFFNWVGPEIGTSELPAKLPGHVIMSNLSEGGTVLGSIEAKSNQLVVTANSRQRAERAKAMIGAALAGLIGVPTLDAARRGHDDPHATYDLTWLWSELGIPERRV